MSKLLLLSLLLYSLSGLSALSPRELAKKNEEIKLDIISSEKELNILNFELKKIERKVQVFKTEALRATVSWEKSRSYEKTPNSRFSVLNDGYSKLKAIKEKADKKYKEAKINLETKFINAKKKIKALKVDVSYLNRELEKSEAPTKLQLSGLRKEISTQKLSLQFVELKNKFENIDDTIDEIEDMYDNALVGAYVQDKIGQLLNSQVICAARRRCLIGDPKKIPALDIQKELFPTSKQHRSEYYNKVNSRK